MFEYNPGSGIVQYQLPLCSYEFDMDEIEIKTINESLDKTYAEIDDLGSRNLITLKGSLLSEAQKLLLWDFEKHANKGGLFNFAPHYPTANRPAFFPEWLYDCYYTPDSKIKFKRSENAAGMWDFEMSFFGKE